MRFDVREPKGEPLSDEDRQHLDRQVRFALSRFADRIRQVRVSLGRETNGAGTIKKCSITVTLRPAGTISVRTEAADLRTAVARAAERIGRHVARTLGRERLGNPTT